MFVEGNKRNRKLVTAMKAFHYYTVIEYYLFSSP
jgi:hypothetical protein